MTTRVVRVGLESSGPVGSVAVAVDGVVEGRAFLGDRTGHSRTLIPALETALHGAGIDRGEVGGVLVGAGPGSFTGVRVAAAAGKGLAHALAVPLWAVSSFVAAALTESCLPPGAGPWPSWGGHESVPPLRCILFDARGDRVFAAVYRVGGGAPVEVRPPWFTRLPEVLGDGELADAGFCGDGAQRHEETLRARGRLVLPAPYGTPTADGLVRLLSLTPGTPPLRDPFSWEPEYLRESNAERGGEA